MSYRNQLAAAMLLFCLGLAACQTTPAHRQHLTAAQVAALKGEGFVPSEEGMEFSASDKLLFGSNEASLVPEARQTVDRLGRLLLSLGIEQIRVDGHTDSTGSPGYNEQLSLRRARAVGDALVAAGFPEQSIRVRGLGMKQPVASNQTAEGRLQNRRVVVVVVSD